MFRKKKSKKPTYTFPRDLKELGYHVDEEGRLKTLEGEPYKFDVREKDRAYNEALYDVLIDVLSEWTEDALQNICGLVKTLVPLGSTEEDIHSKIYVSPDYMTNDKMIIFAPGTSHKVGIWSRRVLSDDSVLDGTMITYTKRAMSLGFSVVITNPNEVFWYKGKGVLILPKTTVEFDTIPGSESPEAHVNYVFKNCVIPSAAQNIVIVGNSYGGHCVVDAIQNHFEELYHRIKAVEFTASTHSIDFVKTDKMKVWIRERCRNWLMSDKPIGNEVIDLRFGCLSVSSGSDLNEYVTSMVVDEIFSFIEKKVINPPPEDWDAGIDDSEEDPEILDQEARLLINGDNSVSDIQDRLQFDFHPGDDCNDKVVYEDAGSGWSN